jgi:hypothetical protein
LRHRAASRGPQTARRSPPAPPRWVRPSRCARPRRRQNPLPASQSSPAITGSQVPGPRSYSCSAWPMVIEADPQSEALAVALLERNQLGHDARPLHRAHGIGEHQHLEAAFQRRGRHRRQVRVHERLAAGEADLGRRQPELGDLVIELERVGEREIGQLVIAGRGLDIAVGAGDVAQRAGVDPQGLERHERHARPGLALRRSGRARGTWPGRAAGRWCRRRRGWWVMGEVSSPAARPATSATRPRSRPFYRGRGHRFESCRVRQSRVLRPRRLDRPVELLQRLQPRDA